MWSEISSVLMTLQCIDVVEMLELMLSISVLSFYVSSNLFMVVD